MKDLESKMEVQLSICGKTLFKNALQYNLNDSLFSRENTDSSMLWYATMVFDTFSIDFSNFTDIHKATDAGQQTRIRLKVVSKPLRYTDRG